MKLDGGGGYEAVTPQGEPFSVHVAPDEAAGICNRTNRKWVVGVCNIEVTLGRVVNIVVFTDGSVTPDPVRVGVNRYAGWARLYGALPRKLSAILRQKLQPIRGGALNRGAKISFAELVAVNHVLGEIIEMLDDLGGASLVVLLCMDSEGCADELERALREEGGHGLPAQLLRGRRHLALRVIPRRLPIRPLVAPHTHTSHIAPPG